MPRRPGPRSAARRDQILALLREAGRAVSTPDVIEAVGQDGWMNRCRFEDPPCPDRPQRTWTPDQVCPDHGRPIRHGQATVYPLLRALAREGLVECIRIPGDLRVYWLYQGDHGIPVGDLGALERDLRQDTGE